ncbi:MAG: hypothetical protein AB1625_12460 [Acidobacteriota bacterium]
MACAVALLVAGMAAHAGHDPCKTRICREDYTYDGHRCRGKDRLSGVLALYDPPRPPCKPGWRVDGQYCVKDDCCCVPACRGDEKYSEGQCTSGPSGTRGYGEQRKATCPEGFNLDTHGWCRRLGCQQNCAPPPPAVAAPRPPGPPAITGIAPDTCVDPGRHITIQGRNLMDQQGPRRVVLSRDGVTLVLRVLRWSSQAVVVSVPDDARLQRGRSYAVGIQDLQGHWLTRSDITILICLGF